MSATQTDILLVDDSLEDVELTTQSLQREKLAANIHVVRDGEEALDFLFCRGAFTERSFDRPPKIVLLDLKLPKVNGIQVLEQLKDDQRTKFIPVVILSSSNEERDLLRSYELGVNSYIQKPVDFEKFCHTVKTAVLYWLAINHPPPPPVNRDPSPQGRNRDERELRSDQPQGPGYKNRHVVIPHLVNRKKTPTDRM
jgi:two-component system, response regulator